MLNLLKSIIRKVASPVSSGRNWFSHLNDVQATLELDGSGIIQRANESFQRLMSCREADIVGKHYSIFVEAEKRCSENYRIMWQKMAQGEVDMSHFRYLDAKGRHVWADTVSVPLCSRDGSLNRVFIRFIDDTKRQLKNAIMESQLKAIDRVQAVVEFNLDGTIKEANGLFLQVTGYTRNELIGQHHRILMPPEERNTPAYKEFWRILRSGEHHVGCFRRIGRDGRDIWLQASYSPVFDAADHVVGVIKYATDVTARFSAAEAMKDAIDKLKQTVDHTVEASHFAQQSFNEAENGADSMQEAVSTMGDISDSSGKITAIIKTMDDIAFQTNLLALNASVEAARAHEHGKGFAVVAAEVRELAQNSAQAANEIRALIKTSNERIDYGQSIIEKAEGGMREMVNISHKLTDLMGQVARESGDQSEELTQMLSRVDGTAK